MRTESSTRPAPFTVEQCGDIAEIILVENVSEDGGNFVYDEYRINVPYRSGLNNFVSAHFDAWLQKAKEEANRPAPPTMAEELETLKAENAALKVENEIMGKAVEELITTVLEGGA